MSTGGANPSNGSPRLAGPTTTRRRVADMLEAERSSNFSDMSDEEDNANGNNGDDHRHHPAIRYWLLRSRILILAPETWLLKIEDVCSWAATALQWLRSGKHMGRKIFGGLFLLLFFSVFAKLSLMSSHVEVNGKRENGLLIIQTFKEDWGMAQKVVAEDEASDAVKRHRILEKIPVSDDTTPHSHRTGFESLFFLFLFLSFPVLFGSREKHGPTFYFFSAMFVSICLTQVHPLKTTPYCNL